MTHQAPAPRAALRLGLVVASSALAVALSGCSQGGADSGSSPVPTTPSTEASDPMDQQHVRAELRRRGGFVGLERCATLDTAQLAAAEAERLRASVDGIDLGELGRAGANPRLPTLDLTVVRGEEQVHAVVDETTLPAAARPLVSLLDQVSGPCS